MSESLATEKTVYDALRQVIDPEMGIDIVELGLIYGVRIERDSVSIKMTLTMRGCPMHESITNGVRMVVLNLDGVEDVDVGLVWDPPWNPTMMSPEAQEGMN